MFRGAQTAEERAASHAEEQRITEATLRAREVKAPRLAPFKLYLDQCVRVTSREYWRTWYTSTYLLGIKKGCAKHDLIGLG